MSRITFQGQEVYYRPLSTLKSVRNALCKFQQSPPKMAGFKSLLHKIPCFQLVYDSKWSLTLLSIVYRYSGSICTACYYQNVSDFIRKVRKLQHNLKVQSTPAGARLVLFHNNRHFDQLFGQNIVFCAWCALKC